MVYGDVYANEYDQLYSDKDYQSECDLIDQTLRRFGTGEVRAVLDLGCGTGNHSLPLAHRGYHLTGVDLSAEMLRVARRKSTGAGMAVNWVEGDIRTVDAGGPFDAALFMFAVLGYLLPNVDVMAALANARRHLRPGGLLAFDVWYGPAVLSIRPSDRVKVVLAPGGKAIRTVTPRLHVRRHTCELHYHLWRLIGDRLAAETEERHSVRYFFPMELELMLSHAGFELTSLTAFPTLDCAPDETTWNVFVVAKSIY